VAARFTAWFDTPGGRAALVAAGLRPPDFVPHAPLTPEWGVQPDLEPAPAPVDNDLLASVRTRHDDAHRPGRVLLAIDASESMRSATPGGSRWEVARRGAESAFGLLRPPRPDELGVWVFQGVGRNGIRRLVPLPGGQSRQATNAEALKVVHPQGPAPLFDTILAGIAEVRPANEERTTALVILTDGQDDNASTVDVNEFRAAVEGKQVRVYVVAMGTAGCAAPVLKTITTATGGECLEADPGAVTAQLATIFEAVL
jgi:hypothetical protein